MVVVSEGHVGGICAPGIVSSAADVLGMSVVQGIRVGEVCEMCMAQGGIGGEGVQWMRRLGLGFGHVCVLVAEV